MDFDHYGAPPTKTTYFRMEIMEPEEEDDDDDSFKKLDTDLDEDDEEEEDSYE